VTTRQQKKHAGLLAFVGVGPGDERLVTVRGTELVRTADVVAGPGELLERFQGLFRPDAELLPATEEAAAGSPRPLVAAARDGRRAVRLVAGDPGLDATVAEEIEASSRSRIPVEVVPGVPAGLGVALYAGILSSGRRRGPVVLVDADGPPPAAAVSAVFAGRGLLVATGSREGLAQLAGQLVEQGHGGLPGCLTVSGTTTGQRTVEGEVAALPAELAGLPEPAAVMIVGDAVAHRGRTSWFETKPLFGWRVLVPRTKEQSGELCERLRSYGAVPVEVPTIAVEPPRTPQAVDRAIHGLVSGRYQWVAFTSTNAVRAVREKIEELGLDARAFAGVKVAAVGEATAAAVAGWGIRPDLVPSTQQSSEGLLADWPEYEPGIDPLDRVFLPRADIATETLAAGLVEKGWQVDDVTAYRTVRAAPPPAPTREAIKTGGFDAVLFTSSSTVRNLVGIAGKPHASSVIAVIGPQTAKTAEELGLRVDVMAASPSALQLADSLAEFGLQRRLADDHQPPGKANRNRPPARPVKKAR
jgi:uroporphyrinogen III methyltransferase/synthase